MRTAALAALAVALATPVAADAGPAHRYLDRQGGVHGPLEPGEVRVVSAGDEPRTQLRYHVAKGTRVKLALSMKMSVEAGGTPVPQPPSFTLTMVEQCVDVEPSGTMRFEIDMGSMTFDGTGVMTEVMRTGIEAMEHLVLHFRLAPSGAIDDIEVQGQTAASAAVAAQLKDNLEQFAVRMPDRPVGPGAVWKTRRVVRSGGVEMSTVNRYVLRALVGPVATVEVSGRIRAPVQTVNQGGVTVQVTRVRGTGTGTFANDLRRFTVNGQNDMTMDMTLAVNGQVVAMHMVGTVTVTSN